MTFSYDLSQPDDLTRVRFLLQDTDADTPHFQDEEIRLALSDEGSIGPAALSLVHAAIARLAAEPDQSVDGFTVSLKRNADTWGAIALEVRRKYKIGQISLSAERYDPAGAI